MIASCRGVYIWGGQPKSGLMKVNTTQMAIIQSFVDLKWDFRLPKTKIIIAKMQLKLRFFDTV